MIVCMYAVFTANAQNTQTNWAREFKVKDGVIYADGKPFPLIAHCPFSFVTPKSLVDDSYFRFWSRMGGNVCYILDSYLTDIEKQGFKAMDQQSERAAKFGLYWVVLPAVADFGGRYAKTHPDVAMKNQKGDDTHRPYGSFTHEGYRAALVKALKELAAHCKDQPYFFGYWLQDEFSYPGFGGYEAVSVNVFRDKMMTQYGTLDKLNAAWGTKYLKQEDIVPPKLTEQTGRRWADWQLFRRWAYTDLLRVCYQAIKEVDPHHIVINSMSFWPYDSTAASWWIETPYMDVVQRHGIGYSIGFNFMVIRDIAEWSGKAGSALYGSPGSQPSFVPFMLLLDASRSGLSHVSVAGPTKMGLHYRGAADSDDGFRRREPQYTPGKAIIQLQHYLGDTYLTSKRRSPQVGYFIGDQKVTVAGGDPAGIAGMLEILTDLDLDFEVLSEHNYAPLKRFQAVIIGPEMQLASDQIVTAVNKYVQDGGAVILMPGAFEKNEWNEISLTNLFPLSNRFGKPIPCKAVIADGVEIPVMNAKSVSPVEVKPDDKILARIVAGQTNEASAVVSGDGKTLFLGWDVGVPYKKAWSEDFANVGKNDDAAKAAMKEFAFGPDAGNMLKTETTVGLQPQRRIADWVKDFLAAQKVSPYVIVKEHETPGLVHAKSFTVGSDIWLGIANRMVKPGQNLTGWQWDMEKYPENGGAWPADLHVPITNAVVFVRLPENFPERVKCFLMPNMTVTGKRLTAVPQELPVEIVKTGAEKSARFRLDRIDDWAAIVLSPSYKPLVGMELENREIIQGTTNVHVKITLLNASDKTIKGELDIKDEDGLCKERPSPVSYELKPGETKTADLTLSVTPNIKTDYYSLKAVAVGSAGTSAESMGLEVRILEPVIITLKPDNGGYFYVKPDAPAKVEVKTVLRDDNAKGTISAELEGFTKFTFEKNKEEWTPDSVKEHTFVFTVETPQTQNITELGKVIVRGSFAGGLKHEWSQPLRITAGAIAYRETRKGQISNGNNEISDIEFACLENEHLIARFMITNGVLHNLIVRRTGMELLSPDYYPFGLTWYNRRTEWTLKSMEAGQITLSSGPISMTASIKTGQESLDVSYDATGVKLTNKDNLLLMSRISKDGILENRNVMHIPLKNEVQELKWRSGGKEYKPGEIAKPWLAVEDKASHHILATFFDVPDLEKISLDPGVGLKQFNYETFYLKDGTSAGKIHFRLFGAQGGIEKILEWEKMQKDGGQ